MTFAFFAVPLGRAPDPTRETTVYQLTDRG